MTTTAPTAYAVGSPEVPPSGAADVLLAAFADPPYRYTPAAVDGRLAAWSLFRARPGFRCVQAHEGGRLVGLAWGWTSGGLDDGPYAGLYRSMRTTLGDTVERLTGDDVVEVVEVAVTPGAQGHGVGAGLLARLTTDAPAWLLTRPDAPAAGWYRRHGWTLLATLPGPPALHVLTRGR